MSVQRTCRAFTLVELLVVIGIIALLISILLPSLNRARQSANVIDCQSRLRQVHQACVMYAGDHRGVLPLISWHAKYSPDGINGPGWFHENGAVRQISRYLGKRDGVSPIFRDKDTATEEPWGFGFHYTLHHRAFHNKGEWNDSITGQEMSGRKIASISNSTEAPLVWDAPQLTNWGNVSVPSTTFFIDNWGYWGDHKLGTDWGYTGSYDRLLALGTGSGGVATAAGQRAANRDEVNYGEYSAAIRFRHAGQTTANVVFADGHVGTWKVGEVRVRDLCMDPQ